MKLTVLAGAKEGTQIPLKKEKFTIGRSSDCTLRAGSEAISRRHCLIVRSETGATIRDLGSRNGTYVNGKRIEAETPLKHGDELKVGPLRFTFHNENDLQQEQQPKVKEPKKAAPRTPISPDESHIEEDISRWLLGPEPGSKAMHETRTFRLDETQAASPAEAARAEDAPESDIEAGAAEAGEAGDKKGKKSGPGKLPPIPKQNAKDSREAATNVLREMARRR